MKNHFSTKETCKILNRSASTLRRMVKNGKLGKPKKVGGECYWSTDAVFQYFRDKAQRESERRKASKKKDARRAKRRRTPSIKRAELREFSRQFLEGKRYERLLRSKAGKR